MQIDGARDEAAAGHWSKNVPVGQVLGGLERGQWSADDLADPTDTLPGSNGSSATDWLEEVSQLLVQPFYIGQTQQEPREQGHLCDKTVGVSL